jgi:hypothetical protein
MRAPEPRSPAGQAHYLGGWLSPGNPFLLEECGDEMRGEVDLGEYGTVTWIA